MAPTWTPSPRHYTCGSMTGWRSARRCARDGARVGIAPKLSDAELLTLAVLQLFGGFNEDARWLRHGP